jgi:dipeptidyl aminopeptidase/acylaminoacyl peptidase
MEFHAPIPVVLMLTGDGPKGTKSLSWANMPPLLEAQGIASFLFDFHGLGYSEGRRDELTLAVGLENAQAAVAMLFEFAEVDKQRIALFGSSFGGNVAVLLASQRDKFVSLGLKSPVSFYPGSLAREFGLETLRKWASDSSAVGGLGYRLYMESLYVNTYQYARSISCPVLITHGDADPIVPIEQSVHLRSALQSASSADLTVYPGADHHYSQQGVWDRMAQEFVSFFHRTLA